MSKVAVVCDSNSGITQERAKELGIFVLPMPFIVDGREYHEEIDITQQEFFRHMEDPNCQVSTSQPAPGEVTDLWDKVLKDYDELVYIPMSSGLSASCQTARMLAAEYDGRVEVVNNQRISVTQEASARDALYLIDHGWNARDIRKKLEEEKFNSSIYIMVDTLKYLQKGGRVTAAAALIGSMFRIKPVLQIQGEKLDAFAKARGSRQGRKIMLDAIRNDMDTRFKEFRDKGELMINYSYTYSSDESLIRGWVEEIQEAFPGYEITGTPLSLSIGCHIGPSSLAVTVSHRVTL